MKIELFRIKKAQAIKRARATFWHFCKLKAPEFYKESRPYLKKLCNTLQLFAEDKLLKPDGTPYQNLIINMPPRFGKSRTLFMFVAWLLGINPSLKFITASYNNDLAIDFSRYTRDLIAEERATFTHITYSDIFPETRLKHGDKSVHRWALIKRFFSYLGTGMGGTITGRGGNYLIADDLIKGAKEAYNANHLETVWKWFTGTFLSRKEEGHKKILPGTRWAKKDIFGRLKDEDPDEYYELIFEAKNLETGEMLCEEVYSAETYEADKRLMDEDIFWANYHQKPVDIEGILYKDIHTYTSFPTDDNGNTVPFETILSYADTADQGDDYLCNIIAGMWGHWAYILDVYYTQAGMEVTEPETALRLNRFQVVDAMIESNSGGRGFARAVIRHLEDDFNNYRTYVHWFHQSENKNARILTESNNVQRNILFPANWRDLWPEFHRDIINYTKQGPNEHDDGPDTLTGLAELINRSFAVKAVPGL